MGKKAASRRTHNTHARVRSTKEREKSVFILFGKKNNLLLNEIASSRKQLNSNDKIDEVTDICALSMSGRASESG